MKTNTIRLAASAVLGAALLAACGGGDDDLAGSQTEFTIVPETTEVTGAAPDTCPGGGYAQEVQVIGGSPPYLIFNTSPNSLSVTADRADARPGYYWVDNRNGHFVVTWGAGCFDNLAVTVIDRQGRLLTFGATASEGQ